MRSLQNNLKITGALTALIVLQACDKGNRSFSLLEQAQSFSQETTYVQQKIDIIWMIDNSGSMASSQQKLRDNFQFFIQDFQQKNYDFNIVVQTTDAWIDLYAGSTSRRPWKSTVFNGQTYSVLNKNTPNLTQVFQQLAMQGTGGSGDERAFASLADSLLYADNSSFRRPDAHLAVIIVSDEDDFSSNSSAFIYRNYNDPRLYPVSYYNDFLKNNVPNSNFSVHAISVQPQPGVPDAQNCLNILNIESGGLNQQIVDVRYSELARLTGGSVSSLCEPFNTTLQFISDTIQVSAARNIFKLDSEPQVNTIQVIINGQLLPESATDGWSYQASTMSVILSKNRIPNDGDRVEIKYIPVRAQQQ